MRFGPLKKRAAYLLCFRFNRNDPLIGASEILSLLLNLYFFDVWSINQGINILHDGMVFKVLILSAGPHPNGFIRACLFDSTAELGHRANVLVLKRITAQHTEAGHVGSLKQPDDALNRLIGKVIAGIKVPGLWIETTLAVQSAARDKERNSDARAIGRVKFS